jgi:hypothetical protein
MDETVEQLLPAGLEGLRRKLENTADNGVFIALQCCVTTSI